MCDVTNDLKSLISKSDLSTSAALSSSSVKSPLNGVSPFHSAAAEIGRGIQRAESHVTKLKELINQQGLFDDPVDEINKLIFRVKQDLDALNQKCDDAQTYVDHRTAELGSQSHLVIHNSGMVSQLKLNLMGATKIFKSILEIRSSKVKDQQTRKEQLTGRSLLSPSQLTKNMQDKTSSSKTNSNNTQNIKLGLPNPYEMNMHPSMQGKGHGKAKAHSEEYNQDSTDDEPAGYSAGHNLGTTASQSQRLLLAPPIASQQYYSDRENAVTEVEKTIVELGTLYQRLGNMLTDQQSLVERIDDDIEMAAGNAEAGGEQLMKAYQTQTENKNLYWKLGGIATVFTLVFTIFLL